MTQDYKDFMLDYLAGNKTDTTMVNEPILEQGNTITNNLRDYLYNIPGSSGTAWIYSGIIQPKNSNKSIMYGNLDDGNNNFVPYIIVLDENYNPLGYTTTFDSGTSLSKFEALKFDENNKLYGIDNTTQVYDGTGNNTYRFIMLDNPIMNYESTGSVSVKLRRSYFFPSGYNTNSFAGTNKIIKDPNNSKYLMVSFDTSSKPQFIELEVNVGSANTWTTYASSQTTNNATVNALYVDWSGENVYAKMYSSYYIFTLSSGSVSRTTVSIPSSESVQGVAYVGADTAYYGVLAYVNGYSTAQAKIYKYNGSLSTLWTGETAPVYATPTQLIRMIEVDGLIVFNRYVETYYSSGTRKADTYSGVIYNDEVYEIKTNENMQIYTMKIEPLVTHNYNLWKIGYQEASDIFVTQMVFNVDNYNGQAGIDVNSGVPHSMRLSDTNGLVFARNLYNMRINDNTITSIMEVPNTYLNDLTITNEDLYSVNNNVLDEQTESIQTNIYETLYINANDTWNMINRNDPLEPLTNQIGATRIVNSTARQLDYDDAKCGVFRVVTSGGYYDRYINPSDVSYDDGVYTFSFNFYGNPSITQIQILSYDKQTVYCTYDVSTQSGKTYTYTQELTIE